MLIASRPIELIRPGDPDWQYQADMTFLEAPEITDGWTGCVLGIARSLTYVDMT